MPPATRLLAASIVTAATVVTTTLATGATTPAQGLTGPSVSVHGRLVVVPAEEPGGPTGYAVALADGDIVPLRGSFPADVRTGAVFDGRLALPAGVVRALTARGESGTAAALQVVDEASVALRVTGTPVLTDAAPLASSTATTVHTQYVAAIDNKGTLGQTDAQLLGHVSTVGAYWTTQSNHRISTVVPAAVDHYRTTTGTTECGLGSGQAGIDDYFALVQEAAQKFPGIDWNGGPDQLVLFVPPSCSTGSTVGRGTVGTGFASGGAVIAESNNAIDSVYAHEAGHNYGLHHANVLSGGTSSEYYGLYDVMGYAVGGYSELTALSTPYRVAEGITDPGEVQDVDLGAGSSPVHVTATIAPRGDTSGLRSLHVLDPDTGDSLYFDYRSGTGPDASSYYPTKPSLGSFSYAPGVTVNVPRGSAGNDTLVVDGSGDTSLAPGDTWTSTSGRLTVTVTAADRAGATLSVDYSPPPALTSVAPPTIGGSVRVGGSVSLDTGSWSPTPSSLHVTWTADGQPVPALDDKTVFTVAPSLAGTRLVATVTASEASYGTAAATSGDALVRLGYLRTAAPTITGTPRVGRTLTASHGRWTSGTAFHYAWYAGKARIKGKTARRLVLTRAQRRSRITVKVTGTKTGYHAATRASAATARVR
jgi:hypothetical protein